MDTKWKDLVGRRVLCSFGWCLKEGLVNEVSPSGDYVKFCGQWYSVRDITLKEVLLSGMTVDEALG